SFKFDLPPGAKVERDAKGNITDVKLDLPADLRQGNPRNADKIEALRNWLDVHGQKIEQALAQYSGAARDPNKQIAWEDIEVHDMKAILDKDRNFVRMVTNTAIETGQYKLKDGETAEDMNLLEARAGVEKGSNGQISVTQKLQAQKVPPYG